LAHYSLVNFIQRGKIVAFHDIDGEAPSIVNASVTRTRNYLTAAEVETLMAAARKLTRYGHRDATMILIAYRHGLRASELCELQWHQVELNAGRLHVRRRKRGTPSACTLCRATRYAHCGAYSASRARARTSSPPSAAAR
jgi:integrase